MNFAEIRNTPGFIYTLGYVLTIAVTILIHSRRRKKWINWAVIASAAAMLTAVMIFTNEAYGFRFVFGVALIISTFFFNIFICLQDVKLTAFFCVKAYIYGEFSSSLSWLLYYNFALKFEQLQSYPWMAALSLLFVAIVIIPFGAEEKSLAEKAHNVHISYRDVGIMVMIGTAVYVMSNLSYISSNTMLSGSRSRDVFAIRTLVDFCGITMLYSFHRMLIEAQVRLERDIIQSTMEMQYQSFQLTKESMEMVNQKYHDLKHQIAFLREQANADKLSSKYLDQMEKEIKEFEALNQTGNSVLDAILTSKSSYCQKYGIELKIIADGKLLSFMDDMEISSLFGNMLDNAIESVQKLPDSEKRLIRLYVSREQQFLCIRLENYCMEKLQFENGMPQTTKKDKRYHGFGMKSMKRTVEKYSGSMVASVVDNWFRLKILIPLTSQQIAGDM